MDFTGQLNLLLYMDIRHDIEAFFDVVKMEYTIDGGTTWNLLGSLNGGVNWYNNASNVFTVEDGWTGDNTNWQTAEIDLPTDIEGEANTQFRVVFGSDVGGFPSNLDAGVAFDNFTIFGEVAPPPLPVELLRFDGHLESVGVVLNWATATELNNDFFEVQHSMDGIEFKSIDSVQGNGTTNELIDYSFTHSSPAYGINFYRLRQVDFDGTQKYHKIVRVDNDLIRADMKTSVYPNPATPNNMRLRISTGDDHTSINVKMTDQTGKVFFKKELKGSLTLDQKLVPNQNMTPGLYFLEVQQGKNVNFEKIIINR